jgi:ElaB/YqjD/DUF883 family membrane-anchored ribosome-binding protein
VHRTVHGAFANAFSVTTTIPSRAHRWISASTSADCPCSLICGSSRVKAVRPKSSSLSVGSVAPCLRITAAARDATDAAVSYAKDAYENSGDTFRDGSQVLAQKVQENPLGALLVAGGIGFALALLMTRPPSRSRYLR